MAFNEALAARVRELVGASAGVVEKRMFGGLAFLVHGNMSVGMHGNELIVRLEPTQTDQALRESGVRIFDITGRPMQGWLLVSSSALESKGALRKWVSKGISYAQSLPPKTTKEILLLWAPLNYRIKQNYLGKSLVKLVRLLVRVLDLGDVGLLDDSVQSLAEVLLL